MGVRDGFRKLAGMLKGTKRQLRIVAVFAILLGFLLFVGVGDLYERGIMFTFLGFLGSLVGVTGVIGGILFYRFSEAGRVLLKWFAGLTIAFTVFYSIMHSEPVDPFWVFLALCMTVLLIVLSRHRIKDLTSKESRGTSRKPVKGKYLRLHWLLAAFILAVVFILATIWSIGWEEKWDMYHEPNGGGISYFASEIEPPRILVSVEGGFVYDVRDEPVTASTTWESEDAARVDDDKGTDLVGEVAIKLTAPEANISIHAYQSGTLRLNLLNIAAHESYITLNGDEEISLRQSLGADYWFRFGDDVDVEEISGNIQKGEYLLMKKGYWYDVPIKAGKTEIIRIERGFKDDAYTRFYVISDTHSGYGVFIPALAGIVRENPEFIIWNGDLVNDGYPIEYTVAAAVGETLPFPVYPTIGNHDAWNLGHKVYNKYFGPYYYSFTYKNSKFIMLDTSTGLVGNAQFKWLEDELSNHNTSHVFVVSHMSPIDTRSGVFDDSNLLHPEFRHTIHSKAESDYLVQLMSEYGVDAFIAGHSHEAGRTVLGKTTYITSGALGGTVKAGDNVSYLIFEVDHDKVRIDDIEVMTVDELNENALLNKVHSMKLFLMPFLINKSARFAMTLILLVVLSLVWIPLRKRFVYRV